ncbi:MAG TPA: glucosidase [Acetobacteraceae bacterium]|nr:glucosidase [Acetobacteraceae bacterium]
MTNPSSQPLPPNLLDTAEGRRLQSAATDHSWRRWGPYLSERQWGTVREDYSPFGTAWDYLPHDQARSYAYRWGEDGIAGFGDDHLHWCMALGLWNGNDPILKERLFGLTNAEGNHGEDVKELYYYLDGTPTHSYMRMLYKYPHAAFPYDALLKQNRQRGTDAGEYEIVDTGVFDNGRYFDVTVEYAKASQDDILWQISVENRGEAATLHVLPQLWARDIWTWVPHGRRPRLMALADGSVEGLHPHRRARRLHFDGQANWLFCNNATNVNRLYGQKQPGPFKDGINDFLVRGDRSAISPFGEGTKCAAHAQLDLPAFGKATLRLRLRLANDPNPRFDDFDAALAARRAEADEFYAALQRDIADPDARLVQRQALAGMLWTKQFYYYDIPVWLAGDPGKPPPPPERLHARNSDWPHLNNADIISMPDKWEYPWYAAWDLGFHCVTFALIDPEFAKAQLVLLTREWYMHPNGQLPAYEWAFGDVNPPVHAWAAWRVYLMDAALTGKPDRAFLERVFHKLMLNFTWWVNRKDAQGRNIFQGGFLGLDNIGLFDRSKPLPTGGTLSQSDGTAWMAMYCLNLTRIAIELAEDDHVYEDIATKFFEHFLYIAEAITKLGTGESGLWDEQDQFFYDVLNLPDGSRVPMRVRTIVGLIPLFAVQIAEPGVMSRLPGFAKRAKWFLDHRPALAALVSRWEEPGVGQRSLLSLLRGHRMKLLLKRMLDENEFLSDHGVRALSKAHGEHPYVFKHDGQEFGIAYTPGESVSGLFGGNSNWRGPIWMPVNFLLIEALHQFHRYYGEDFVVESPVGTGRYATLREVANDLSHRLASLFLRGPDGRRPVFGDCELFQNDPHFRDHLLFHEYFHGDTGRGCGASHQTGWTGLVALLLQPRRPTAGNDMLPVARAAAPIDAGAGGPA